jgi:large subunit ribosomal protein L17
MRHQKKRHKLGRTASHRTATYAALGCALIEHKRIETTLPKAKALRTFIEPIITRAKEDSTHNRRETFRHLRNKEAVKELFGEVATRVGDRPGGYTRLVRLGMRQGDSAEMAVIELVDWNDVKPEGSAASRKKTRRGRSGRGKKEESVQPRAQQEKIEQPAEHDVSPGASETVAETLETEQPSATPAPGPSAGAASGEEGADSPEPAAHEGSTRMDDAPKVAANPEVNMHPDHPQGAAPGTGEPPPETGKGDQGTAGGSRHRG